MRRSEKLSIAAFLALATCFVIGLYLVLQIPLMSGHAYREYSTYRTDPKGMSVLYNALSASPGLSVQRNENSLMQLGDGRGQSLFIAGTVDSDDFRLLIEAIERYVQSGGRLVITFLAEAGTQLSEESPKAKKEAKAENPRERREEIRRARRQARREAEEEKKAGGMAEALLVNIRERWDFQLGREDLPDATEDAPRSTIVGRTEAAPEHLPESIFWRSPYYFEQQADFWRVLYEREGNPVLMERQWEAGSIVLASDTYFLSNEAMLRHRYPALLAWLTGPNAQVVFDETHLGISRDPGIVGLMRRYRLTPVMLGFVMVALLFIWKNSASLVPKRVQKTTQAQATEAGKSAATGLNSLLRRSTPKSALLSTCVTLWRQDQARARPVTPETQARIEALAQAGQAAPEQVYNQISAMLKERERN